MMRRASPTNPSEKQSREQQPHRHAPARARRRALATMARSRSRCRSIGTPSTSAASHRSGERRNIRTISRMCSLGSSRRLPSLRRAPRDRPLITRNRLRSLLPQLRLGRARPQAQRGHHGLRPPRRVGGNALANARDLAHLAPHRHTAAPYWLIACEMWLLLQKYMHIAGRQRHCLLALCRNLMRTIVVTVAPALKPPSRQRSGESNLDPGRFTTFKFG